MFLLKDYLTKKQLIINQSLGNLLKQSDELNANRLMEAMIYSTLAGGKRIRPILCLAAFEVFGIVPDLDVINTACTLEIIHTYSLIHDDLPAMDDDDLRRGKATCHIQFDEATAILAGDALLTFAFDVLAGLGRSNPAHFDKYLHLIQLLSEAAGHKGMVKGQMLDLLNEGKIISLDELKNVHRLKTGAMIRTSVVFGAILGNASEKQTKSLALYADNIGLAFQVMDDILNVEGDPELMGKSVGTDMQRGKCAYPALLGLEKSKEFAIDLVNNALHAIEHFDNKADPLREIANYIIDRDK